MAALPIAKGYVEDGMADFSLVEDGVRASLDALDARIAEANKGIGALTDKDDVPIAPLAGTAKQSQLDALQKSLAEAKLRSDLIEKYKQSAEGLKDVEYKDMKRVQGFSPVTDFKGKDLGAVQAELAHADLVLKEAASIKKFL